MAERQLRRRALLGTLSMVAWPVWAQNRTLRIVAPFPPGGSTDILARALAERLSPALRQAVVVENKPGANGALGTESGRAQRPTGRPCWSPPTPASPSTRCSTKPWRTR